MDDFDTLPKMAGWHESNVTQSDQHMIATNKLRFVEREYKQWVDDRTYTVRKNRVLQQWFRKVPLGDYSKHDGEWRDVPLE